MIHIFFFSKILSLSNYRERVAICYRERVAICKKKKKSFSNVMSKILFLMLCPKILFLMLCPNIMAIHNLKTKSLM